MSHLLSNYILGHDQTTNLTKPDLSTRQQPSSLIVTTTMATSSPSEFLTFYRTIRTSSLRHAPRQCFLRRTASRLFTTTLQQNKDIGPGRDHVLDKAPGKGDQKTNVQSEQSKKGRE